MSVESDLAAQLLAHAPLEALIEDRLAPDKVAPGTPTPYVVYVVKKVPEYLLDGTVAATLYAFGFQCWAKTRAEVEAVADALEAAMRLTTAVEAEGLPPESRDVITGHELDLEGTEITAEGWVDS
jgi:hypothetical protein